MRAPLLVGLLAAMGCTIGDQRPPVIVHPRPDPDRMPAAVLDHEDPAADTSHNPVLWQSGSHASPMIDRAVGCLRIFTCDAGSGGDASGLLVIAAAVIATRPRRRQS